MHTRILMSASAAFLAMLGLAALFLPQELLIYAGSSPAGFPLLVIQVSGALYLGFANLNWMARGVLIGGIYSRPLAMGNFLHFSIVTIVLAKTLSATTLFPLVACGIAYAIFAVWFGLVMFTHPLADTSGDAKGLGK